ELAEQGKLLRKDGLPLDRSSSSASRAAHQVSTSNHWSIGTSRWRARCASRSGRIPIFCFETLAEPSSAFQGRREPSVASTCAARAFASSRSALNAPAQSLESLCFLRAFEMAAIEALSAAELFLTRFDESALAASSRRPQARARRRPTDAGTDCPTQA